MQVSKFLESNTKFSFANHRAGERVMEQTFTSWTDKNFYRTSYNDMAVKVRSHPLCAGRRLAFFIFEEISPECLTVVFCVRAL